MTVVPSDYANFILLYPEFTQNVPQPRYDALWVAAENYIDNTACSIVPANPVTFQPRQTALQGTVAHLAFMRYGKDGQGGASGLVGRVSDATQGSVSVKSEFDNGRPSSAWWIQTPYGADVWELVKRYLNFQYVPGPQYLPPPMLPGRFPWRR